MIKNQNQDQRVKKRKKVLKEMIKEQELAKSTNIIVKMKEVPTK